MADLSLAWHRSHDPVRLLICELLKRLLPALRGKDLSPLRYSLELHDDQLVSIRFHKLAVATQRVENDQLDEVPHQLGQPQKALSSDI